MKKVCYLTAIAAVLLFASCSNEEMKDVTPEVKTYTPIVSGVIGEFSEVNKTEAQSMTKTGVIEDNPNYAAGEKFYWHDGDKAKVLFFPNGNLNATPVELIYTATVAGGTKSNTCQFSTKGSVPAGDYTVYALYPADGWSKDATGYKADFSRKPTIASHLIYFYEPSSKHLKDYMFMKADGGNVTISGAGDNPINFNFKHLTSVVRFHITIDYDSPTNIMQLMMALDLREKEDKGFFHTSAYLNNINGMDLTPTGTPINTMTLMPANIASFVKKEGIWELDLYMPVFPTMVSTSGMKLIISTAVGPSGTSYFQQLFGTDNGLSFDNELSFMPNGFKAGKSYYFNLKAKIL